jgi:hypothetical protein
MRHLGSGSGLHHDCFSFLPAGHGGQNVLLSRGLYKQRRVYCAGSVVNYTPHHILLLQLYLLQGNFSGFVSSSSFRISYHPFASPYRDGLCVESGSALEKSVSANPPNWNVGSILLSSLIYAAVSIYTA